MKKHLIIAAGIIAATLVSCKKKDPAPTTAVTNPTTETFSSLQSYLDTKVVPTQSFSFMAENGATFTAAKGSVITIPANALEDLSGNQITGEVTMKFREVFSNSDIMFSRIFPVTYNGNVLNSGGEFKINFTQNWNDLRVVNGQTIAVKIPAQAQDPGMLLFFAEEAALLDSVDVGWGNPVDSLFSGSGFTFNSVDDTYDITLDSMGWCNIDGFLSNVNYFNTTFNLTGLTGLDNTNSTAFAVFKNQNAVWPIGKAGYGTISNSVINETHLADVPMNIVVISVVGGQLYYGLLDVTPQQGVTYTIPMTATTSAALDAIILGLE